MKNIITSLIFILTTASLNAQDFTFNYSFFIGENTSEGIKPSPDREFSVRVMFKSPDGNSLYSELHYGATDQFSNANLPIGKGIFPSGGPLTPELLSLISQVCLQITITDDTGAVVAELETTKDLNDFPIALFSRNSDNSKKFAGNIYGTQPMTTDEVINQSEMTNLVFQFTTTDVPPLNVINHMPLNQIIRFDKLSHAVDDTPADAVSIGSSGDWYTIYGNGFPEEIESKHEFCALNLNHSYNVLSAINKNQTGHGPSGNHNTAAIFAENNKPDLSAGLHARAGTWGVYATANNGVVGISTGGGNGTGVWGTASQAPDSAGFKYAVLGHAGGLGGVWAAAFFGSGFYTGSWLLSSDARLKTDIQPQTNALDKIMKLRPSIYQYRMDTPYGFSPGLHHGFIAQEMEEVLPELVSEVTMPEKIETNKLDKAKGIEYKAINYTEIISVLTSAVQELNISLSEKIEAQAREMEELRAMIHDLKDKK